jgi:hypothetical protein
MNYLFTPTIPLEILPSRIVKSNCSPTLSRNSSATLSKSPRPLGPYRLNSLIGQIECRGLWTLEISPSSLTVWMRGYGGAAMTASALGCSVEGFGQWMLGSSCLRSFRRLRYDVAWTGAGDMILRQPATVLWYFSSSLF